MKTHYVIFDTETGGLDCTKHLMTEISMIILDPDLKEIERYTTLIKGYDNLIYTPQALQVTGITMEMINSGKDRKVVASEVIAILKKYNKGRGNKPVLVAHNAQFDCGFLDRLISVKGVKLLGDLADDIPECTMRMCRRIWGRTGEMDNFQLPTCCRKVGIEVTDAHRSLGDTIVTAELFKALMKIMSGSKESVIIDTDSPRTRGGRFRF